MLMKKIQVLCAMRDPRVAESLCRAFDERCLFAVVRDGCAAMEAAKRTAFDVLIVDAVLPGLDGVGVVQSLGERLGERMPYVIGGSVHGFADERFKRCGVSCMANVPWDAQELGEKLRAWICRVDTQVDWAAAGQAHGQAQDILHEMGMNENLRGFSYLSWASALAARREDRLYAIGERLYAPIALHENTTAQSVERLIRHAIERTTDVVGEKGIYAFFGNTIDPMRGKPTNAQMIARVAQKIRDM